MSALLVTLASTIGVPLLRDILSSKIGAKNADLATDVIGAIAQRAGTDVPGLESLAHTEPQVVQEAMREVEEMAPQMIALYATGVERQFELMQAELRQPLWFSAWRPGGMYMVAFLWLWNVIILHVINAIAKISLPQMDLWMLFQLTGLYMTLYMGGHTLKDMIKTWRGRA